MCLSSLLRRIRRGGRETYLLKQKKKGPKRKFVATTKIFAMATKRSIDVNKKNVAATNYFSRIVFNKWFC